MDNKNEYLIKAEGLCLSYDSRIVLSDASFAVCKGDYLCIVGENGSGKSTLIKALLGLKKPSKGKLSFSSELKRNHIGYLPQAADIQKNFPASVREVVLSGTLGKGTFSFFYTKEQKRIANKSMSLLGIEDLATSCYRELSGGQMQRVLLARALCSAEKLLVLDEPTAGLDSKTCSEMYKTVKELCEKEGMTIIMITHDLDALKYANKVMHLSHSVDFMGSVEEYSTSCPFCKSRKGD